MKKIFLTLALSVATITFAQQMDRPAKMEKRREMMKDRKEEFGKRKMIKKTADAPVVE